MLRLFTAIDLSPENREKIHSHLDACTDVNWVPPENMHITLSFMGSVNVYQFRQIKQQLHMITFDPFPITLKGGGSFESERRRIYWLGIQPEESMVNLHRKLSNYLDPIVPHARGHSFKAHLTLARVNKNEDTLPPDDQILSCINKIPVATEEVDKFVLYSSKLSHSGSIYTPLEEYHATVNDKAVDIL